MNSSDEVKQAEQALRLIVHDGAPVDWYERSLEDGETVETFVPIHSVRERLTKDDVIERLAGEFGAALGFHGERPDQADLHGLASDAVDALLAATFPEEVEGA